MMEPKSSDSKAVARWLIWYVLLQIVSYFSVEANAQQYREATTVLHSIQIALTTGHDAARRVTALEHVLDAVARRDEVVVSQTGYSGSDAVIALQAGWLARYPEGTGGWQRLETRAAEERGNMARLALRIRNLSASERAEQLAHRDAKGASEAALILLEQADTLPVLLTKAADWKDPDAGLWLACATYVAQRRPANETRTTLIKFAGLDASFPDQTRRILANYIQFIQSNAEFVSEFRHEFSEQLDEGLIPYSVANTDPSRPITLEAVPAIANQMMEWCDSPHCPPDLGHYIQGMLMFECSSEKTGEVAVLCRMMTNFPFKQTEPEKFLRSLIRQGRFERACADALAILIAQPYNADNIEALLPAEHESPAARARVMCLAARNLQSRTKVDPIILQGLKKHWIDDWRSIEFKIESLGSRDPQHSWLPHPLVSWLEAAMGTTHDETVSYLINRWRNDPTAWPVMLALAPCRDRPEVSQLFREVLMTSIRQRVPEMQKLVIDALTNPDITDSLLRASLQDSKFSRYLSQAIAVHLGHDAAVIYLQAIAASTSAAEKCCLYDAAWAFTNASCWAHPWQRTAETNFHFAKWGRWQYTSSHSIRIRSIHQSLGDPLMSRIEAIRQSSHEPPNLELRAHLARSMAEALIPGLLECLRGTDPFLARYAKARVNPDAVFQSDPLAPPDKLGELESAWRKAAEKIN